jgi:glycosyltransferase involved in cell wall biosynthesis
MLNKIFFTIVIPTYNRASLIIRTIDSVLNQTCKNFEILIIDDGSTDNTEEVIKQITDSRIHYHKISNSERGFARNYGTKHSKGDYITFLDSDDVLLPNHFSNASESLLKYNNPPFLHLGYEIVDSNNKLLFRINKLENDHINFLIRGNSLSCNGCFLRRDIGQQFLFNEDRNLSGSEDWELWFRVLANCGIKVDNRVSSTMFNHENRSVSLSLGEEKKLVLRKELALKYAFTDQKVKECFAKHYREIDAFGDSYIALHLALSGQRKRSIHYLTKFVLHYPPAVLSKRFFVIIKCILLDLIERKK